MSHGSREVGSFWWRDVLRLIVLCRGIARCTIGKGDTVLFWEDLWTDNILSAKYSRLYTYAKNPRISAADSKHTGFTILL